MGAKAIHLGNGFSENAVFTAAVQQAGLVFIELFILLLKYQPLVAIEVMKMENVLQSACSGLCQKKRESKFRLIPH